VYNSLRDKLESLLWEIDGSRVISSADRVLVDPKEVKGGFPEGALEWWNWEPYLETWRRIDYDPDTPIDELPIYPVMVRAYSGYTRRIVKESIVKLWVKDVVDLYVEIKEKGFDQDREKRIQCRIGPCGEVVLYDGHHRISMLQHLDYPHVKVDILSRHPQWQKLKYDLFCLYRKKLLYQPIDHHDFDDWDVDRQCTDRLKSILGYLRGVEGKRGLDIGSCTGWFCHELVKEGAVMVGVDLDKRRVSIAKRLSHCYNLYPNNPEFISQRFEKYLSGKKVFDFILFLSLFHHYLRRDLDEAWKAVELVSNHTGTMFLDLPENPKDPLPIVWSPELILEHSRFTEFDVLEGDSRPLYVFTR